jgi:hypothetical protein
MDGDLVFVRRWQTSKQPGDLSSASCAGEAFVNLLGLQGGSGSFVSRTKRFAPIEDGEGHAQNLGSRRGGSQDHVILDSIRIPPSGVILSIARVDGTLS